MTTSAAEVIHQLRQQRKKLGLTQAEVAHEVGVARSSVANFEAGRQDLPTSKLLAYAAAVGMRLVPDVAPPADGQDHRVLLRAGRKPQTSTLRTVYVQTGTDPGDGDRLLGVVEADRLDIVLDRWNSGDPAAAELLTAEVRRAADGIVGRLLL